MGEHFGLNQHVQQLERDLDIVLHSSHNDQKISSSRFVEVSLDVVQRLSVSDQVVPHLMNTRISFVFGRGMM